MANILGIQWGKRSARLMLADPSRDMVAISQIAMVDVTSSRQEIIDTIRAWNVGRVPTVIVVDRSECEVRVVTVPPVPPEELPEIVRFQAMQQFAAVSENSPLDYLPIVTRRADQESEALSPSALAAAISYELLNAMQRICDDAGVQLQGVILAPCGTAEVAERLVGSNRIQRQLAVELQDQSAEICVADGARLLMTRSVRLPEGSDRSQALRSVVTELRRTLASARSQLPDSPVEAIVVCGDSDEHRALVELCGDALGVPVQAIDPMAACRRKGAAKESAIANPDRYVSLIGALLSEPQAARRNENFIDFVRFRRPPEPRDLRSLWTALATVVLAAGFLLAVGCWWILSSRESEIAQLRREIVEVDKLLEVAAGQERDLERIDQWYAMSPNWLLEIRRLSEKLPGPNKLRLERFQADIVPEGGRIVLTGMTDSAATVTSIENSIRDVYHRVEGIDRNNLGEDPKYPWFFQNNIMVGAESNAAAMRSLFPDEMDSDSSTPQSNEAGAAANVSEEAS